MIPLLHTSWTLTFGWISGASVLYCILVIVYTPVKLLMKVKSNLFHKPISI